MIIVREQLQEWEVIALIKLFCDNSISIFLLERGRIYDILIVIMKFICSNKAFELGSNLIIISNRTDPKPAMEKRLSIS